MTDKFKTLTSTCIPLPVENVDTDQIIPARFLKATTREKVSVITCSETGATIKEILFPDLY